MAGSFVENNLHPYIGVVVYKVMSIFSDISLMGAFLYVGALISALCVIPAFFIVRRAAGNVGGFFGASIFRAVREGMFRGIFISEAGIGTSSIPHALADTKIPSDQGVLAMGSMVADAFLSALSGLLIRSR